MEIIKDIFDLHYGKKKKIFWAKFNILQWAKLKIYNVMAKPWPVKTYNYQLFFKNKNLACDYIVSKKFIFNN